MDGTAFPYIPFDIGESYAGNLPVIRLGAGNGQGPSNGTADQQLYFWFFPSENPAATDEITIWLNGGVSTSESWRLRSNRSPAGALPLLEVLLHVKL